MRGVIPFSTGAAPASGTTPDAGVRLWTVIELAAPIDPNGRPLKVRRPSDLKVVVEGRILPLDLVVFEGEEEAIADASARAEEKPDHSFAAVEIVAFAFTRPPR